MYDGKLYYPSNIPKYIYKGVLDIGYIISMSTQFETIDAIKKAGGGIFLNTLHNFSFRVN